MLASIFQVKKKKMEEVPQRVDLSYLSRPDCHQAKLPTREATKQPQTSMGLEVGRKAGQIGLVARCRVLALALTSFEPF